MGVSLEPLQDDAWLTCSDQNLETLLCNPMPRKGRSRSAHGPVWTRPSTHATLLAVPNRESDLPSRGHARVREVDAVGPGANSAVEMRPQIRIVLPYAGHRVSDGSSHARSRAFRDRISAPIAMSSSISARRRRYASFARASSNSPASPGIKRLSPSSGELFPLVGALPSPTTRSTTWNSRPGWAREAGSGTGGPSDPAGESSALRILPTNSHPHGGRRS